MRGRTGGPFFVGGIQVFRPLIRPLRGHLLPQGEKEPRKGDQFFAGLFSLPPTIFWKVSSGHRVGAPATPQPEIGK